MTAARPSSGAGYHCDPVIITNGPSRLTGLLQCGFAVSTGSTDPFGHDNPAVPTRSPLSHPPKHRAALFHEGTAPFDVILAFEARPHQSVGERKIAVGTF
jgi:hypothetical protein